MIVADFNASRLERAAVAGVDATVNGKDGSFREQVRDLLRDGSPFVVDAVGSTSAMNDALSVVANNGKVCVYGVPTAPTLELNSSLAPYHWQLECLIFPTFEIESAVRKTVISHLFLGFLEPRDVIDDVSPFADLPNAIDRVLSRSVLESVIRIA